MLPRVYQPFELIVGNTVTLSDEAHHHLSRVLRLQENDKIILFNGKGGEYLAELLSISRKQTQARIIEFTDHSVEAALQIHLAQGLARNDKMDLIIQKAVELGVADITPLVTEKCQVKQDPTRFAKRMEHWRNIIISACEQSGRNTLPVLHPSRTFNDWIANTPAGIICDPNSQTPLHTLPKTKSPCQVLIGPESGWSDNEVQQAIDKGWQSVSLGPRILRTETAAIAVLSMLLCYGF